MPSPSCRYIYNIYFRLEIWPRSNDELRAEKGSTFIYAWWFRFRSNLVAGQNHFFHVFQVKCYSSVICIEKNLFLKFKY